MIKVRSLGHHDIQGKFALVDANVSKVRSGMANLKNPLSMLMELDF